MDRILQPAEYVFDASAKTVAITLSSAGTVRLENLKLIINQTDNVIIFSSTNTAKQATLAGSTFTLEYDTTTMDDTDALKIIYYDQDYTQAVSVSGVSTAANQSTEIGHLANIVTAVQVLDNFISGSRGLVTEDNSAAILAKLIAAPSTEAKQDTIISHIDGLETAFTTLNAKDFATQTTLASVLTAAQAIQAAAEILDNAISGSEMQVDVVTLPSGLATSANQATIIGHIDNVETLLNAIGTLLSGTLTISGAITGSVTANAGTNLNTSALALEATLQSVKTAVETIDNAISGNEMQVDVITLPALPAGTNNIGDVDVLTLPAIPAGTNTIGAVNVKPATSGGLSIFRSLDLDETEEEIKSTAGQVYGYYIYNKAATAIYVKFYNATAANVTVGTTTPVLTIGIPAGSGANVEWTNGIAFSTAITIAATTGVADNDTTAPAANDIVANIFYK